MNWTKNVEICFNKINNEGDLDSLKKYQEESIKNLTGLIKMVQGNLDGPVR